MEMNFDPMTGEPIQKEPVQQPQMNFDPMTGQPIPQGIPQPQANFDPMTGQPVSGKGGKKKGKVIAAVSIAAAVVLVGGTVFAGVRSGAFLGKSGKVMMAIAKTVADSGELSENLEGLSLLESDSYTMDMDVSIDGESIEASLSSTKSGKQVSGTARLDDMPTIEFLAGIDDEEVKAQIPLLGDQVFVYNYQKEKTGYLADQLDSEDIEAIDELCKTIYSGKEQTEQSKELAKTLARQYKELEFTSVTKETFEVDGKDRTCKGYQTAITEDFMMDFCDNLEDYAEETAGDALKEAGYDADLFDDLRDEFEDMPDMDVTFYIYKGKLACVDLECEGEDMQLVFHGGKTRTQNMELIVNRDTLMELEGETNGDTQDYRLYAAGSRIGELEYNTKTGEYELSIAGEMDLDGVLKTDRAGFQFSCSGTGMDVSVDVKKGAKLQKIEGDELDIGNASESELMDVFSQLYY